MDIIRHETRRRSSLVGRERSEDSDLEVKACSGFASGWLLAGACVAQAHWPERSSPAFCSWQQLSLSTLFATCFRCSLDCFALQIFARTFTAIFNQLRLAVVLLHALFSADRRRRRELAAPHTREDWSRASKQCIFLTSPRDKMAGSRVESTRPLTPLVPLGAMASNILIAFGRHQR